MRAVVLSDRARYLGYLQEILDNHLSEAVMTAKINAMAELLAPHVEADPHIDTTAWRENIEWQLEELEGLRARLMEALP